MPKKYKISVLPGDGIGKEVIPQAVRVMHGAKDAVGGITIEDITDYQLMMENALFAEKMSGVGMLSSGIAHDMKGIFAILGLLSN